MKLRPFPLALAFAMLSSAAEAQQSAPPPNAKSQSSDAAACPMHNDRTNMDGHAKMNERGEKGMGFSQTTTTHHFFLKPEGGIIQVEANDPKDTASRDSIRMHLTHIAHAFSDGDFDIPMFVHGTVPPGAPEMKRLKEKITYAFERTPNGARILMRTADPTAIAAIHQFLRFQIEDHQTKDPTTIQ